MPDGHTLSTASLLRARSAARGGLLASATATVTVAVATVCAVLTWLVVAVGRASDAAPPGVPADEVTAQVDAGVSALVAAAPAVVLLVVILAATAVAQLARLLAVAREHETTGALARGLSRAQAIAADAIEATAVAFTGAIAGLGAVAAGAWLLGGGESAVAALTLWWAVAATAALLGIVLVARPRSAASGRAARTTTAALVVVLVLAAVLAVWQLRSARPSGFDLIVAVAPTVVLLAVAIVVLAIFGAAATAWTVPTSARRGLRPAYSARQVARRLPVYAVAVLLVSLTVAQAVFASAYGATWTTMATDSAAVRAGADLRVDLEPQSVTPAIVAESTAVAGVDAAAPALVIPVEIGSTDAQLVAVPTDAIQTIVSDAGGLIDLAQLTADTDPSDGSVSADPLALGPSATGLRIDATVESTRRDPVDLFQLTATVRDASGATAEVRLDDTVVFQSDSDDRRTRLIAAGHLPMGTAPWSLVAVTATIRGNVAGGSIIVTLDETEAIGGGELPVDGQATLTSSVSESVIWLGAGGDRAGAPPPVRAVLGIALAERLGLAVGETVEFRYGGTGRRGEIVVGGIDEAIPGASTTLAVFAPLEALQVSMLQRGTSIVSASSLFAAGSPSADVALSASLDDRPVATAAPGVTATIVGALVPGWWIAAAGSAILSLIAAFAIAQTLALARRRELGVLRALGVAHGRQARMRAAELSAVLGGALVLGAAGGVAAAWSIVPELVRAVTPGILPLGTATSFAWPALAVALSALAIGLGAVVLSTAAQTRRAARAAQVGEEAR